MTAEPGKEDLNSGLFNRARVEPLRMLSFFIKALRIWQRLSRQHLIAHSGVVDEDGFHHSCLLQIRRG